MFGSIAWDASLYQLTWCCTVLEEEEIEANHVVRSGDCQVDVRCADIIVPGTAKCDINHCGKEMNSDATMIANTYEKVEKVS